MNDIFLSKLLITNPSLSRLEFNSDLPFAINNNSLIVSGNLNEVSSMQDTIILYKEKQIKELEAIPKTVVNVNYTRWYVFGGIIVSSIAAGLITGFFIK